MPSTMYLTEGEVPRMLDDVEIEDDTEYGVDSSDAPWRDDLYYDVGDLSSAARDIYTEASGIANAIEGLDIYYSGRDEIVDDLANFLYNVESLENLVYELRTRIDEVAETVRHAGS